MEGIVLILIGTAIFSHSWYLLGLYADGRTTGVIMAGLGIAMVLSLFTFAPQFINGLSPDSDIRTASTFLIQTITVIWAIYALAVAAQALWDLEERAIGFYSILLFASSIVFLLFFVQLWIDHRGNDLVMVTLVAASSMLIIVSGLLFANLAIPFHALRRVAGWAMLIQSLFVVGVGMGMVTAIIGI